MKKDGGSSQPVVILWKDVPSELQPGDSTVSEDNTDEPMCEEWDIVSEIDVNIPRPTNMRHNSDIMDLFLSNSLKDF